MALNPIAFTERVIGDFLRNPLAAYPFSDARLHDQMRRLFSLEETRKTPLLKGPCISLSRAFKSGAAVSDLVGQRVLHPIMANLIPYKDLFGHQERAIRAITSGKTTHVSTDTGSGKTAGFLCPELARGLPDARPSGLPGG